MYYLKETCTLKGKQSRTAGASRSATGRDATDYFTMYRRYCQRRYKEFDRYIKTIVEKNGGNPPRPRRRKNHVGIVEKVIYIGLKHGGLENRHISAEQLYLNAVNRYNERWPEEPASLKDTPMLMDFLTRSRMFYKTMSDMLQETVRESKARAPRAL